MPFNHYNMGSTPIGLNSYRLTVDLSSSTRCVLIRIQLAVILIIRISNLIGNGLSYQESRYRIVSGLIRRFIVFY